MDSPLLTETTTSPSSVNTLHVWDIVRANWEVGTSLQLKPIHPVDISRGYQAIVLKLSLPTHVFFNTIFFGATEPHELILVPEAAPTITGRWGAARSMLWAVCQKHYTLVLLRDTAEPCSSVVNCYQSALSVMWAQDEPMVPCLDPSRHHIKAFMVCSLIGQQVSL